MRITLLLADVAAFILCCLGLVQIQSRAGLPITVTDRNDSVFCSGVTHEWFAQTLHEGEAILAVNAQSITHIDDLEFVLDGCSPGDTVALRIAGPAGTRIEHAHLVHYYNGFYLFSVILVSALFFVVGLVVLWKKPGDPAALVYHIGSVATAVQLCTTWGSYLTVPAFMGAVLRCVFATTYAFIPVTFFHLMHLFPRRRRTLFPGLLPLLYGMAAILAVGSGTAFVRAWAAGSVELFHDHLNWFTVTRLFLIVLVFSGLGVLYRSYVGAGEESERRKLRWVLWGMFVGLLPFVVLWVIPFMVVSYGLVPEPVMLLASGVIPLAFGISIVKYHILDIDPLLNRSLVYGTVMALVVLVYTGIVGGVAMALRHATYSVSLGLSAGAAIIVALLFEPTRRVVQRWVDRRFFRVRYDFRQAARKFQEDVKSYASIDDLGRLIVERVETLLPVEGIALFLAVEQDVMRPMISRSVTIGDQHLTAAVRRQSDEAGGMLVARAGSVEPGVSHYGADATSFDALGIDIVCPLVRADRRLLGMLLLGPKKSGTRFTSEDVDLLANIAAGGGAEVERILLQRAVMEKADEASRLERLNAVKSEFVSYVSHELRTPLTSIKMFAELLAGHLPRGDRRGREYVGIISGESDRLQRMVNTILDSARIDQGESRYTRRSIRIDAILKDVLRTLKYQMTKEKFRVELDVSRGRGRPAAERFVVAADPDAVREALLNLLTNAMKYSGDSRTIRVALRRTGDSIRCSVEDSGRGIAPESLPHLFEKFYRDPSLPGKIQGVGLGLSVVKHIMDAHGGRVEVRSIPEKGSTFTLVFPRTAAARSGTRRDKQR